MNKKTLGIVLVLFILILLLACLSSAACTSASTPHITSVDFLKLAQGDFFVYDFNLTNMPEIDVSYALVALDKKLAGISINDNGLLAFTPLQRDVGVSRIAVIAVKESCAETRIITLNILDRPDIVFFAPETLSFEMNQTGSVDFRIRAEDTDENDSLSYEWFIDSELINESINQTNLRFKPGYRLSGVHEISVKVTDSTNLSDTKSWYVQIAKVNRPPVLINQVPSFMVFMNTESGAYNLNDYFLDPEGGKLVFDYRQVVPSYDVKGVSYANITVGIDGSGFVTYNPSTNTSGHVYFTFTAHDILNKSAESNLVRVDVAGADQFTELNNPLDEEYCGDSYCGAVENCSTCPFDCGPCENPSHLGCIPNWNCTEWSLCQPAGFQLRNCTDTSLCDDNRTRPDTARKCEYNATCEDGLKNGIEEGVDCGGICPACSTCNDTIQNQGEEGIDCGGPCPDPCPSCTDNIKNQNESDIDCGGECSACPGGKSCLKNLDCESLRCDYMVCTLANCSDSIKNQNEESIDCGGPCTKLCGNCSDGIQNRGEDGIDCGGRCEPCAKCDDGIKNDDERLVDCGGNCKKCEVGDYIQSYLVLFIILAVILGIIPLLLITYIFFLFAHPEKARRLYENNVSFALLINLNRFFRKFRKPRAALNEDAIKRFSSELTEMGKKADGNKPLHDEIVRIYSALLGLPEEYDEAIFNTKLKLSTIPLFLKILLVGYYKRAEILVISSFVPAEEKTDLVLELKFLLSEAGKG